MADGNEKQWFEKDDGGKKKRPAPSLRPNNRQKRKAPQGGRPNGAPAGRPQGNPGQQRAQRPQNAPAGKNAPNNINKNTNTNKRPAGAPVQGKPLAGKTPEGGVKRNTTANRKPTGKKGSQVRGKTPPSAELKNKKKKAQVVKKAPSKKPVKPEKPVKKENTTPDGHVKLKHGKVDSYTKDRRKRARNRGLKTSIVTVGLVFMAVTLLIFVVHHLFNYIAVKPNLEFITSGSVEHTIGARALIVRDEEVVVSATEGDLVTQATEGSRVNAGQNIAMVVPSDMEQVVSNLRDTQSQISEVQQELIMEGLATGADSIYDNINGSLGPIMDMIRIDAMNGNVSDMASYSSSISVLLSQRETELSGLEFDDERLRTLRNDEAGYEAQLENHAAKITAPSPGIISFKLDGLENELTFDTLLTADASTIRNYINDSVGIITSDLYVKNGENLARIASNEKQYLAVFLDEKNAPATAFEIGTLHTINVGSEGISIGKCVVERVESTSNGLMVIFSTTRYVEDLLDLRTVDIEIVITESSGLRVPISALVSPDYDRGVATIYVNNQGFADEVGVIVEDYDREFAIVKPLGDSTVPNLQTVIVTNPSSISPGDKIDN